MLFKSLALVSLFALTLTQPGISYLSRAASSAEPIRSQPVTVGEEAPDFTLEDIKGDPITLSSARGKMPTVLIFSADTGARSVHINSLNCVHWRQASRCVY